MAIPGSRPKAGNAAKANGTSFKPGQSGNPAGRKKLPAELREAREAAWLEGHPEAVAKVRALLTDPDSGVALRAAMQIIERVEGKVAQKLEHDAGVGLGDLLLEVYTKANK